MRLASAEYELISCAKDNNGEIKVVKTQAGKYVVVGERQFGTWDNLKERRKYLDALNSLENKELVKYEGGTLFCLTSKGFETPDALESLLINDLEQSQNSQPDSKLEQSPTPISYDLRGATIGGWADNHYGTQQIIQIHLHLATPNPSPSSETP
jgi:hypothetical protein